MTRSIVKAALFAAFLPAVCLGQPQTEVHQDADRSSCSNIVALTGNVNVNCSTLTPAQLRAIQKIPDLVKEILENKTEAQAILAKLDEILQHLNPNAAVKTYNCYGWARIVSPGASSMFVNKSEDETFRYEKLSSLNNQKKFNELLTECRVQIKTAPEWLTPYLFSGLAYIGLGDRTKAKEMLDEFDSKTGPAYSEGDCKGMADFIRQRTGPTNP